MKLPWNTLETSLTYWETPLRHLEAPCWHFKCTTNSKDTKRKKRDTQTDKRTNGRTEWVTTSHLELLIAAKNTSFLRMHFMSKVVKGRPIPWNLFYGTFLCRQDKFWLSPCFQFTVHMSGLHFDSFIIWWYVKHKNFGLKEAFKSCKRINFGCFQIHNS